MSMLLHSQFSILNFHTVVVQLLAVELSSRCLERLSMTLHTLTIALDKGEVRRDTLPAFVERDYLGGRGAIAWLLTTRLSPDSAPLSKENLLLFAAGPLAGTNALSSGGF